MTLRELVYSKSLPGDVLYRILNAIHGNYWVEELLDIIKDVTDEYGKAEKEKLLNEIVNLKNKLEDRSTTATVGGIEIPVEG